MWRTWTEEKELASLVAFDTPRDHHLRRSRRRTLPLHDGQHRYRRGVSRPEVYFSTSYQFKRLVFTWGATPMLPLRTPRRDPNPHRTLRPHRDDFPPARIRRSPRRSVRVRRLVRCARQYCEKIYLNKRVLTLLHIRTIMCNSKN